MTTPRSGLAALLRAARREVRPGRERPVPCMDDVEWGGWDMYNRSSRTGARIPCVDCTPEFSAEMREVGLCAGAPGMTRFRRKT